MVAEVVQGAQQGSRGISGVEGGLRLGEGVGDRQQEGHRGGLQGEPQETHGRWLRAQEVDGLGGEV